MSSDRKRMSNDEDDAVGDEIGLKRQRAGGFWEWGLCVLVRNRDGQ